LGRNRRLLLALAVIVTVLAGATTVSTWQAIEANAARRLADKRLENEKEALKSAAVESAIAQTVNDFLQQDLLGQAANDPQDRDEFLGSANLTVREALDRAADRIGNRFKEQPLVEAAIRMAIGESYCSLQSYPLAVPHLERAVAVRESHLRPDHPDTIISMERLAAAYSAANRYLDAIALRQRLVERHGRTLGPEHEQTLACMIELAEAYPPGRQMETTIPLLEKLLEKQQTIYGPTHSSTLGTMHHLARNLGSVGQLARSIDMHEKTVDGLMSRYGHEHPWMRWPLLTFAQVCQRAGELDRAEGLIRQSLAITEKSKSLGRWRTGKSNALGWLALNMYLMQRFDEGEVLIRQTLKYHEKEYPDGPRTFYWKSVLGVILLGQQRYAEAEDLILQGYEGMKQYHGVGIELAEAGERVVHFYDVTKQPAKARAWRDKLRSDSIGSKNIPLSEIRKQDGR
jgi:hypothetical protein